MEMDKKLTRTPASPDDVPVSFRPVTEGLGFHPFSDGLPYAPMGKNPKQKAVSKAISPSGAGAVSAGPPRMASPQVTLRPPSVSKAALIQARDVTKRDVKKISSVQPPKKVSANSKRGLRYVATRSLAYLFDVSLNSLLMGGILIGLVLKDELQISQILDFGVPTAFLAFFLVSSWGLIALQEILFRSSLGKYLFHLKLDGSRLGIVIRALLFPLSVGFFGLGMIWGLFHVRRSCWHDILRGLQPSFKISGN
jgi:hypothetical protein